MDWEFKLIFLYLNICSAWKKGIHSTVERHSNNKTTNLTDEEVATIFIFGILSGHTSIKAIHTFTREHLKDYFPNLVSYQTFNSRLNRLPSGFISLTEHLCETLRTIGLEDKAVDSFPIILAGSKRSQRGKVAPNLADKGYCASKKLYFYGVKLHCIGDLKKGTIPFLSHIGMAPASNHDQRVFEQVSPDLEGGLKIFADKAYSDESHVDQLAEEQNVKLLTPIKKIKDTFQFKGGDTFSQWVSSVRQPIESLFNWIQEKTKIQNASKVRSENGLVTHVFARMAAAFFIYQIQNFNY